MGDRPNSPEKGFVGYGRFGQSGNSREISFHSRLNSLHDGAGVSVVDETHAHGEHGALD